MILYEDDFLGVNYEGGVIICEPILSMKRFSVVKKK